MRTNETNVWDSIDAKKGETLLRFLEFYVAKEQFSKLGGRWILIVGNVGGSGDCEFIVKLFEAKL